MKILFFILALLGALFDSSVKLVAISGVFLIEKAREAGFPVVQLRFGANTLTSLIPDCYIALDVVSRELTGFIPSVARDSNADRIAANQTARVFQTPANTSGRNITPAMSLPATADQVLANKSITISKSRAFPFNWTGEEQMSMGKGPGYLTIKQDQIAQAIRSAVNEIETDLATLAASGASRAVGTAGTTPFASDVSASALSGQVLDDNGAPKSDRQLVLSTAAGAKLRSLGQLTKVNESGDDSMLRQGTLLNLNLFNIRESAQILTPAIGTSNNAGTTDNAGYAVGATSLTVAAAGTGSILAGDVVTFAGDTNQYVVATGVASLAAGGTLVLQAPGLRKAMSAATKTITVVGASVRNVGFTRNAMLLATRLPAVPEEKDIALMREVITDPRTGLSFEVAVYPGYRMVVYEIGISWGYSLLKPEHMVLLLG